MFLEYVVIDGLILVVFGLMAVGLWVLPWTSAERKKVQKDVSDLYASATTPSYKVQALTIGAVETK